MNTISTTNISSDESQPCDSKKSNANVSRECGFLSGEDENDHDERSVQLTDVELLALPLEGGGQPHRLQVVLVCPDEAALHHVRVVDLAHALDADGPPVAEFEQIN